MKNHPSNHTRLLKSLLFIFYGVWGLLLNAQSPSMLHYNKSNWLPVNNCYTAAQDKIGFIWLATEDGIFKYDGYVFKRIENNAVLENKDIFSLGEDRYGRMWVGTKSNKLCYVDINTDKIYQFKPINAPMYWDSLDFEMIYIDTQKDLWVQTRLKGKPLAFKVTNQSITAFENTAIYGSVYSQNRNILFLRKGDAKYCLDVQNFQAIADTTFTKLSFVYMFMRTNPYLKDECVLSLVNEGYFYYKNKSYLPLQAKGAFCGITQDYLFFYDKNASAFEVLNKKGEKIDFPPITFVNRQTEVRLITEDNAGNLWITTRGDGVYVLPKRARYTQSYTNPNKWNNLSDLEGDGNGNIILAAQSDSIYYWRNQKLYALPKPIKMREDYERKLVKNGKDLYLMGERNQLVINLENNKPKIKESIDLGSCLKNLTLISPTELFAIGCSGVTKLTFGKDSITRTSIQKARAYVATADKEKNIWIGTQTGLYKIAAGTTEKDKISLGERFPICKKFIKELRITKNGFLWVGTERFGAYIYDIEKDKILELPATKEATIYDFYEDDKGIMYLATDKGIYKFGFTNLELHLYEWDYFGIMDGLYSKEVKGVFVQNDTIFATNENYLTVIPQKYLPPRPNRPNLVIEQISIFGSDHILDNSPRTNYELAYHQNRIVAKFVSFPYVGGSDVVYKYRLVKDNQVNVPFEKAYFPFISPVLEYPFLSDGKYQLEIYAEDAWGQRSDIKVYTFNIAPPWWKNYWFYAALIISISLVSYLYFKWRASQKEKLLQQLFEMEKRAAKWKLDTLQLQLNPHFIFNALGSIQSYILKANNQAAEKYLVKFSNLIRTVLDSSRKSSISIDRELKLLKDYIDLEQMRFPHQFQVHWEIDKALDDDIEIPSMMLQPFVENAIEWGLLPKQEKGNLWIRMKLLDKSVQITIEDDGVGREQSESYKTKFGKRGTGNAMKILKEREAMMQKLEGIIMKYEIIDKPNHQGTIVSIILPCVE